jgi:tetratricopeptide (TPR) repeat protein
MTDKRTIRMTSKLGSEFDSEVVVEKEKYLVQTEDSGEKRHLIITRIYFNGQILLTRKTDYSDMLDASDREEQVRELMGKQHRQAINLVRAGKFMKAKTTSEYLEEVKELLKGKNKRAALRVLSEAIEHYPDDPFILSYYGCLDAIANKNYRQGIDACLLAIEVLKRKVPFGEDFFFPVFYLNLGRAYLAAGKRKEAMTAFNKGLAVDAQNKDILWEIRKLGIRQKPPVRFLQRSNPINRYIGIMLHAVKK